MNAPTYFKKSDLPLVFTYDVHDSPKSIIENRIVVGIGGHNGGNRSARSTQDVGDEWRRRQRRDGTGVSGGFGVDSSVDAGHVRFEVAVIESKLSKDFDKGVYLARSDLGFDKGVRLAGIDKSKFMSDSFETTA